MIAEWFIALITDSLFWFIWMMTIVFFTCIEIIAFGFRKLEEKLN